MKKILSILLSLLVLLSATIGCSTSVQAAQKSLVKLNTTKVTSKYDITGDNKADKIKFVCESDYYGSDYYNRLKVYINDKLAYSKKDIGYYSVESKVIKLKNGKTFVTLAAIGNNEDCDVNGVYQYSNGKLKNVINFKKLMNKFSYHCSPHVIKAEGNTITVSCIGMYYSLGSAKLKFKYTYTKGKFKIKKDGTLSYVNTWDGDKKTLTTNKKISVYKSTSSKKANTTIPKNKKVKLTGCRYVDGKLFIKMSYKKKTYWLKASTKYLEPEKLPFKNLVFGG